MAPLHAALLAVLSLAAGARAQDAILPNPDVLDRDPDALTCNLTTEYPAYGTEAQEIDVVLSLVAPENQTQEARLSITSVLDTSLSMSGRRIGLLREVNDWMLTELAGDDGRHSMGVVTFADNAQVLFPRVNVTPVVVGELIDLIRTNTTAIGNTNIEDGLATGLRQQQGVDRAVPVVFILTDGEPTRGRARAPPGFTRVVREAAVNRTVSPPTVVYSVGLGGVDLDILQAIADEGNGQRFVVPSVQMIPSIFGSILGGLRSVAALELKLGFEGVNGAEVVRVQSGWRVETLNGSQGLTFANLYLEERRDVLVTLRIPAGDTEQVFLRVGVNYTNATTFEEVAKEPLELVVGRVGSARPRGLPENPLVEVVRAQYLSCEAAEAAINLTKGGDVAGAVAEVDAAVRAVEDAQFFGSQSRAPRLEVLRDDLLIVRERVSNTSNMRVQRNQTVSEFVDTVCKQRPGDPNPFNFSKPPESVAASAERAERGVLGRLVNLTFTGETQFPSYSREAQELTCLVSVEAPRLPTAIGVVSVVAVVDVSASMAEGGKLAAAQAAVRAMFEQLAPDDTHTLGLVAFSGRARVVENIGDSFLATDQRLEAFNASVNGLSAAGDRDLAAGLEVALRLHEQRLSNRAARPKQRAIFLFTDLQDASDAAGGVDVQDLKARFPRAGEEVAVHAFGLGAGANASAVDLLGSVARAWSGERHVVPDAADVPASATRTLSEVLEVIADPVDLRLEAINGAALVNLIDGAEATQAEGGVTALNATFRHLGEGDRRDVLVNVSVPAASEDRAYLRATGTYRDVVRFVDVDDLPPVEVTVARSGAGSFQASPGPEWAGGKKEACAAVILAQNLSRDGDDDGALAAIAEVRDAISGSSIAESSAAAGLRNALDAVAEAIEGGGGLAERTAVFDKVGRTVCNGRGDPPLRPPVPIQGPPPRGSRTDAMLATGIRPEFPSYSTEAQTVKVAWNAVAPSTKNATTPLWVTCVIDNSASMKSTLPDTWIFKLDFLKSGALQVVDRLAQEGDKHRWGLVTFSSNVTVAQELSQINATRAKEAISAIGISEGDDTDLYAGLMAGLEQHVGAAPDGAVHSVLLFTDLDGEPTGSLTSTPDIIQAMNETLSGLGDIPMQVNTFGLGDVDGGTLDLLQQVADAGTGRRLVVLNSSDIPTAVNQTVENLLDTFALDLDVQFRALEGSQIVGVVEGAKSFTPEDGTSVNLTFSDLVLGERRDVVLLLNITEGNATDVLQADANYTRAGTNVTVKTPTRTVNLTREAQPDQADPRDLPHWAVTRFDACLAIETALNQTIAGNRTAARETIMDARIKVQSSPLKERDNSRAALRDVERELERLELLLVLPDGGQAEGNATFDNALSALCNGRFPPVAAPAPLTGFTDDFDFDGLSIGILAGIGPEGSGAPAPRTVSMVVAAVVTLCLVAFLL
eukprot:evm.model.scf_823.10 EVM.evm.TU.scf_823.10   scf_823:53753-58516(-)